MYCKHCGNQIDDNSLFCNKCGKSQTDENKVKLSKKEKIKVGKAEKIARVINILFFVFAYFVAFTTFVDIAVAEGGINPAVLPAIIIFVGTLLLNIFVFKKKQIAKIKEKCGEHKRVKKIIVSAIYILLPIILFFGSFEYSYYVTIGNSEAVAQRYMKSSLREELKNPESLQLHNITFKGQNKIEDETYRYYNIVIDYSAQNGFGGYARDKYEKHLRVNKTTAQVTEISMKEYTDKMIEVFDNRRIEQYKDKLSSINTNIPFDLICNSQLTYNDVNIILEDSYDYLLQTTQYKGGNQKGAIEITTECTFDKFNGQLLLYFEKENQQLRRIEFCWNPQILYYDENEGSKKIGEGQTATITDITNIEKTISDALKIQSKDVSGQNQSLYPNAYLWEIDDVMSIELEWADDENNGIGDFLIKCSRK